MYINIHNIYMCDVCIYNIHNIYMCDVCIYCFPLIKWVAILMGSSICISTHVDYVLYKFFPICMYVDGQWS